MELYIAILPEGEKKWYPAHCDKCGWFGSSKDLLSDGPIADTGCCGDIYCPICGSMDANEGENLVSMPNVIESLKLAHAMLKSYRDKAEDCDCSKHIYSHFEKENREMAEEIKRLTALINPSKEL